MKRTGLWVKFALVVATLPPVARAVLVTDLYVPGITGEESPPGFTGAMSAQSVTVGAGTFSAIRRVDSASPQIVSAVAAGTHLGTSRVLLYNTSPPAGAPDASIALANTLATAYTPLVGTPPTEQDSFASTTPLQLYLEIPGITGPNSTPGHANVMQLESVTFDSGSAPDFTVVKNVDSASPQIGTAIAAGTHFPIATLLVYDATPLGAQPDQIVIFHQVLGSSQQFGGGQLREQDTFSFATVTPEPAGGATAGIGIAIVCIGRRSRRSVRECRPYVGEQ
jgi:type VI protein secretion system component Hcp